MNTQGFDSYVNLVAEKNSINLALGDQFGFHNIAAVPNQLSDADDQSHKQWYKSGPNAFLYFLYKSPKYKRELAKIANTSICCCCACKPCISGKMGNIHKYYKNTRYCALFCCDGLGFCLALPVFFLYFCHCNEVREQHRRFYGGDGRDIKVKAVFGSVPKFRDEFLACCHGDWYKFRHELFKGLEQSGVEIEVPWRSTVFWQYTCCTPCVNVHTQNILDYYFYKRYGFILDLRETGPNSIERHVFGSHYTTWRTMVDYLPSSRHPLDLQTKYREEYVKRSRENNPQDSYIYHWRRGGYDGEEATTGVSTLIGPFPQYKMMEEWTNLDLAIQYHNIQWDRVHKIALSTEHRQCQSQKVASQVAME
jgi:hypothetical protein